MASRRWIQQVLQAPVPGTDLRLIDMVVLPIGMVVAMVVCLPILLGCTALGAAVALALEAIGAPSAVAAVPGLLGFGVGLVLSFVVLLRLYRRLPASIRALVTPDDDEDRGTSLDGPPASSGSGPDTGRSLEERIAIADAALAAPVPSDPATTRSDRS